MNCWKFQRLYLSLETPIIKERVGAKFTIGRDRDSLIQCRSTYVSRKHLKIELLPSRTWVIKDCGSLNGTFVNKARLKRGERRELKEGDLVGVGVADIYDHCDSRSANTANLFVFKFEKVDPNFDIQRAKRRKRLFKARKHRRQKMRSKLSGQSSGESASCEGSTSGPAKKKKKLAQKKKRRDNESSESTRGDSSSDEVSKSSESDDESVLMSCQICWDKFALIKKAGKELHSTPCGHIFCHSCVSKSLTVNPHCPVCRTFVQPGSTHRVFL